jgi:hypothetical protein
MFVDHGLKIAQFAFRPVSHQLVVEGIDQAGGIVSAILKTPQAFEQDGDNSSGSYIANYSAHLFILVNGLCHRPQYGASIHDDATKCKPEDADRSGSITSLTTGMSTRRIPFEKTTKEGILFLTQAIRNFPWTNDND